jgi:hypothetical protein
MNLSESFQMNPRTFDFTEELEFLCSTAKETV